MINSTWKASSWLKGLHIAQSNVTAHDTILLQQFWEGLFPFQNDSLLHTKQSP